MSPEEGFQKPAEKFSTYPWYYSDVPIGFIVAFVVIVAIAIAIELRPFRAALPFTVVAHGDTPVPWKAPLPGQLPMPSFRTIPPPPVIPPPTVRRSAIDAILAKGVSSPEPPDDPAGHGKKQ